MNFTSFQWSLGEEGIYGSVHHPTNLSKAPYGLKNEVHFKLKFYKFVQENISIPLELCFLFQKIYMAFIISPFLGENVYYWL